MFDFHRHPDWVHAKNPMLTLLGLWGFFSFSVQWFVKGLNRIIVPFFGFPLGFFVAAQGALVLFVILLFWFAQRQERLHGDSPI